MRVSADTGHYTLCSVHLNQCLVGIVGMNACMRIILLRESMRLHVLFSSELAIVFKCKPRPRPFARDSSRHWSCRWIIAPAIIIDVYISNNIGSDLNMIALNTH